MNPVFEPNQKILFQGDSITDCQRNRDQGDSLGNGYAMMAAARLAVLLPDHFLKCLNRGISGNRVKDLQKRWGDDCLDLKPDWVSILIGANDVWRRYDSDDPTSTEAYIDGYRALLKETVTRLSPDTGLILCEPFVLPTPPDREAWREDLDPKIQAVRQLAREFRAIYVPFDGIFAAASCRREPAFWAPDGVHPSPAGHALMAEAWLRATACL